MKQRLNKVVMLVFLCSPMMYPILRSQQFTAKIVFVSEQSGSGDIYLMNPDGTGVQRLTTSSDEIIAVGCDPGMRRLYYSTPYEIWGINTDGSQAIPLEYDADDPDPSPDGTSFSESRKLRDA